MRRLDRATWKLIIVLGLVIVYFFVELFVGYIIQSLALTADAFHMLSDFVALIVGIVAQQLSRMPRTSRNTFGWQRADVVGSLINSVILCTLCFTIFVRAIERFIEPHPVHQPLVMVGVGSGGLLINLISLGILGHHGHPHISHDHTYNTNDQLEPNEESSLVDAQTNPEVPFGTTATPKSILSSEQSPLNNAVENKKKSSKKCKGERNSHSHNKRSMNISAVIRHVIADALGSVIVVISALIIHFLPARFTWTVYVDPAMSMLLVVIIVAATAKLLYQSTLILLQSVPKSVKYANLKEKLDEIDGASKVHDLHIWRLQGDCIIGTLHIRCTDLDDYIKSMKRIKDVFHDSGVHCTTIQPEFDQQYSGTSGSQCRVECGDHTCNQTTCCPTNNPSPASTRASGDNQQIGSANV